MSEFTTSEARRALKEFLAVPALVFSATLLVGAILLLVILTPGRFPVQSGTKLLHFSDLTSERDALRAEHEKLLAEENRVTSLTPTPMLNRIFSIRTEHGAGALRAIGAFEEVVQSFEVSKSNAVSIDFLHATLTSLSVSGNVRDNQGRSTQLLASFIDRLRESGSFTSVSEPEYQQTRGQDGSFVSPFAINTTFTQQ